MGRLLVAVGVGALVLQPVAAGAEEATPGACPDGDGVTVIVDAQELSSAGPASRCAPRAGGDGFAILTRAGVSYETAKRSPGFVCRIAGLPADDPCQDPSPANAYWSYWLARRGGTWCLSNRGAGGRTPPPGTVDGWSFAKDRQDSGPVPPRTDPPPPVPGTPPADLASGDCDSVSRTGVAAATSTTTTATARGPAAAPPTTRRAGSPTTTIGRASSTTTTAAAGALTDATTTSTIAPLAAAGPPVTLDVAPPRARGGAGPALGAVAVIGALAVAGAVVAQRRRRLDRDGDASLP